MDGKEENPPPREPQDAEPVVPDKQVHRWKDDGGAVAPEPDVEVDDIR